MQPRNNLGLTAGCSVIEMYRGKAWAQSNFGEAVWFDFMLPVKEDA
jgi:signal transduction histidine kinase